MQCTDKGSMVRAQYCSEWTELGYGMALVRFLCSEITDEGTNSIVCSYLRWQVTNWGMQKGGGVTVFSCFQNNSYRIIKEG